MSTQSRPETQHTINLGGALLEEVESFKYLGSSFTAAGQARDETSGRIGLVHTTCARLKSALWPRRKISLKTKYCIELVTDRRAWSAIVRDVVNALEDGQFRPG